MILEKIYLGLALAAPIGPVSAEMIRRGLKSGFWAAFNIRLGGALGNSFCLMTAFFGLSFLAEYEIIFSLVGMMGATLLLYMGTTSILKIFKTVDLESGNKHAFLSNSFILGFVLAVANPISIAFWLGIGAAGLNQSGSFAYNFLIIVGVLLWGATLSLLLEFGRRMVTNAMLKTVTFMSGTILLYFGCKYGLNGAQKLYLLLM